MGEFVDYHVKLIDIAEQMARQQANTYPEFLRKFRTIYRHLAATVDGVMAETGYGPYGGMPTPPNVAQVLEETDKEIESL